MMAEASARARSWSEGKKSLVPQSCRTLMKHVPTSSVPRIVVVGGGISGLAAAHRILEQSQQLDKAVDVQLLEAGSRLGGVIHTGERDGFLVEGGPDSFISEKPWALSLCHRL